MQEETRNTVYLAISLLVAAITLTAIAYVLHVRSDYANTRYEEKYAQDRAEANRKYSMYNDNELTGAEVVALIRNYYTDGEIDIYVDLDKFGNSFLLDGTTRNLDYTLVASKIKVSVSYTSQPDVITALTHCNNYIFAEKAIASLINGVGKYQSYLIYDGASVKDFTKAGLHENNSIVTGIYVKRK